MEERLRISAGWWGNPWGFESPRDSNRRGRRRAGGKARLQERVSTKPRRPAFGRCHPMKVAWHLRAACCEASGVDRQGECGRVPPSAPSQFSKGFRLSAGPPYSMKPDLLADLWLAGLLRLRIVCPGEIILGNPIIHDGFALSPFHEGGNRWARDFCCCYG